MAKDRRTRSRVEELGVQQQVDAWLAAGVTYEEIALAVEKHTGESIGKSSVARYHNGLQRRLQRLHAMRESAEAMAGIIRKEGTEGEPDLQLEDMLLAVMSQNLLEKGTEEELDTKEITFLAHAASSVASARTQMEKARQTERKRFARAWQRATKELKSALEASGVWPQVEAALAKYNPVEAAA